MNLVEFPLIKIFAFFVPGIVFAYFYSADPKITLVISIAFILSLSFLNTRKSPNRILFSVFLYCAAFFAGVLTVTVNQENHYPSHYTKFLRPDTSQTFHIVIREKLKSTAYGTRYIGIVRSVDGSHASGRLMLNAGSETDYHTGKNLIVIAKGSRHKKPQNPAQFDYGKYLENKSIYAQVYITNRDIIYIGESRKDLYYYSDQLRRRIISNIRESGMNERELHVVSALILGQQQEIAADIIEDYRLAGAVHILSVSGLHVGFIILFIDFLLKPLPNTRRWRFLKLIVTIISLWGFAFLAGLSPSVIRSAAMFSLLTCGNFMRRGSNIFHTLIASAILILLVEPMFLFDVGFQLSYSALFFILWLQPELDRLWSPKFRVVKYFWTIFTVSVAAQIGTFPLSVYYFHQFPGLFFITNLVIIPFLSIVMILGVIVIIFAASGILPQILTQILDWCIVAMNAIIGNISDYEQFVFTGIPMNAELMAAIYLALISTVIWIKRANYTRLIMSFVFIASAQFIYLNTIYESALRSELIVFHRKKHTTLSLKHGRRLIAYSTETQPKCVTDYSIENFCRSELVRPPQNLISFENHRILMVDTALASTVPCDILMLRNSPKINLDRWLRDAMPKQVIADGTNYKSYVERWKLTCQKRNIPFHHTGEKGYYALKR